LRDVIEQVTGSFRLQAQQKHIQFQVEILDEVPPMIEADQALLQQALYNLVENAIKYTSKGGKVWVLVSPRRSRVLFEVRDTGIGISPVDQPRLFERFYRSADRKAKKERGTGLGLAIVKSIVERHGGRVGVRSQLGQGSSFYFELPVRQPKPDEK
jgi:signal transduction histidine kinase